MNFLQDKPTKLFIAISAFFVANALIAECIGGKIFSLERLLGLDPVNFTLLGQSGLSFSLTCGVLLWPLEFIITDIVNEYYGPKAVRRISYIAVTLIGYAFLMFYMAIKVAPAAWWPASGQADGVPDMQQAFGTVFGQGMWIIAGSLVAFLVSQVTDVFVFHRIKKATGEGRLWLRATGSTLVSQLIDSFIVLAIAFKLGRGWSWGQVTAIALVNYSYKLLTALVLTPVVYLAERGIARYVGEPTARQMKRHAMGEEAETVVIPTAG